MHSASAWTGRRKRGIKFCTITLNHKAIFTLLAIGGACSNEARRTRARHHPLSTEGIGDCTGQVSLAGIPGFTEVLAPLLIARMFRGTILVYIAFWFRCILNGCVRERKENDPSVFCFATTTLYSRLSQYPKPSPLKGGLHRQSS